MQRPLFPDSKPPAAALSPTVAEPLITLQSVSESASSITQEPYLQVYGNRSVYVTATGQREVFPEGAASGAAKARLRDIKAALGGGYITALIEDCRASSGQHLALPAAYAAAITELVESVTSENGRAIVGLAVLQLTVKAICPEQSIRLHKAGASQAGFSWREGLSMRTLDSAYITPVLRHYELLSLNRDGFMMTRSLAENYPYTALYKAAIRGARVAWLHLVDGIEAGAFVPEMGLRLLVSLLLNRTADFKTTASQLIGATQKYLVRRRAFAEVLLLIETFVGQADHSARLFEVAMHSLMQVFAEIGVLDGFLKPLSQMRSANKKHGNIGDIERTTTAGLLDIREAWDAKYGKPYLRDELDELSEKLAFHPDLECVGFVTDGLPDRRPDILHRAAEIAAAYGIDVHLFSFREWVQWQLDRYSADLPAPEEVGTRWLLALAESIGQQRRALAPIDEPTLAWVKALAQLVAQ